MTTTAGPPTRRRSDHAALIIDSDATVEQLLVPVLRHHVAEGTPALLVVGPHTERVLRTRLGRDAEALEWGARETFYQRLGFAFAGFRDYLREQHARGRRVHVIAEPDVMTGVDAPADRVAAYLGYESVCGEVYAPYGCPITCLWDSRRHPTLVIEGVRSIHDHELTVDGRVENDGYIPAAQYLSGRADVAMLPPPDTAELDVVVTDLRELIGFRAAIGRWAQERDFAELAADHVVSATNEVVTNGMRHGVPPVRVRAWHHDATLVVHVEDQGGHPIPADAGYRPPARPGDGAGLWIARQLADVLLTQSAEGRTAVRLHFPHEVTHRGLEARAN
ncbi:MEDS domain-containing protein [Cryptosporangium minutisporangium]|uniref:Anti-sigma regulatory factor (Ser/Thr protein kinase) n=1 Tax=Cryptosporangium minutisporangium TaxID=113569 RepID=A0ABP6T3U8_9ACTN